MPCRVPSNILKWTAFVFACAVVTIIVTFAAQSVGQLTHALVYLSHLPVALIQRATDPYTKAQ